MPKWLRLGDALARRAFELRSSLSKSFRAARRGSIEAGAGDETRTRDINLGKVALYQLSYTRACEARKIAARLQRSMRQFAGWEGPRACCATAARRLRVFRGKPPALVEWASPLWVRWR
jgi:hypothetical protein